MAPLVLAVLAGDQVSKWWIQRYLAPGESVPVWAPFLFLTHVRNPGAAFGLLGNATPLLIAVAIGLVVAVVAYRKRLARAPWPLRYGVALGVGGALGNLVDRVRLGRVVDFIDLRVWPVFNLADVAIVVGAALVFWSIWRQPWVPESEVARGES